MSVLGVILAASTVAPVTASVDRHAATLETFAKPYEVHDPSPFLEWAPLGCQIADAGTALLGKSTNPQFNETGPVARHLIDRPVSLVVSKVALGIGTRFLVRRFLGDKRRLARDVGRILSIGACAHTTFNGTLTNLRSMK